MIAEIQKGAFNYLLSVFNKYGIDIEFKYDPDLDLITEFRKSPRLRVEYANRLKDLTDNVNNSSKSNQILGLFNRRPIAKSRLFGNNQKENIYVCNKLEGYTVELRNVYRADIDLSIKLLFDSVEASDIAEMVYGFEIANQHRSYNVTYDLGTKYEEITNVPYSLYFSELEDVGAINSTNLRNMSFSCRVEGVVITPFVFYEDMIEQIETKIIFTNNLDNPRCEFEDKENPGLAIHNLDIIERKVK